MNSGVIFFTCVLFFALWLEYRHLCTCRKRHNPYELIDLQREMQEKRERENASKRD